MTETSNRLYLIVSDIFSKTYMWIQVYVIFLDHANYVLTLKLTREQLFMHASCFTICKY